MNGYGGANVSVNVDDTGSDATNVGTLTNNSLTGLGMGGGLTYQGVGALNISLGSGNNTFTIASTNSGTVTSLHGGSGVNTINVQNISSATTITTQANASDVINAGLGAGWQGSGNNGLQGLLTITGNGRDIMNIYEEGGPGPVFNTLTGNTLNPGTGQQSQGIAYTGVAGLNIFLAGSNANLTVVSTNASTVTTINVLGGNQTINIQSTAAGSATNINTPGGVNVINIGSKAPQTGGITNNIQGDLVVNGAGNDTMNIDDTGSTATATGTLTGTTISGLGMDAFGIVYNGLTALNISLGSGADTFTIVSTSSGTTTTLNTGSGNDTVNILSTASTTIVNTQGGTDVINVGSLAPATNGILSGVQGGLTVTGDKSDTLNVDDTGSTATTVGTLTNNSLTGLGMVGGLVYQGVGALNISLGSGNNTFTIASTNSGAVTSLHGGSGVNTINVQNISSATTVTTLANASDVINAGLASGWQGHKNGLQGLLTITGNSKDVVNVWRRGRSGAGLQYAHWQYIESWNGPAVAGHHIYRGGGIERIPGGIERQLHDSFH